MHSPRSDRALPHLGLCCSLLNGGGLFACSGTPPAEFQAVEYAAPNVLDAGKIAQELRPGDEPFTWSCSSRTESDGEVRESYFFMHIEERAVEPIRSCKETASPTERKLPQSPPSRRPTTH